MSDLTSGSMATEAPTEVRERTPSGGSLGALIEQKSKLAEHVGHRPQKEDLIHKNIIKDYTPSVDPKLHGAMRALVQHQTEDKLSQKLGRRQSWQKLVSQGIMLEQPLKHSPQVVLATQALRKQRDRDKLARFLSTRPSLEQINALSLEDTMTWERFATQGPPPSARNCHTMTAIGNNLYLLGGYGTNSRHMELTVLETSSQRCWTRPMVGGELPLERYSHTCCRVDGKLVVFGGFSFNGYRLNDLHVLDTDNPAQFYNQGDAMPSSMLMWYQPEVKGTPPCARAAFTATTVDKKIYFFGGNDGQNLFNDIFVLDTETWTWTECHTTGEVPTPRAGHTANLVNPNTIVVFGGGDVDGPSNHLYIFDVDTLEWTQPKIYGTPPSVRMGHTATTVNTNQFIVFGGNFMDKVFNDLHMFDIETLQWSRPSDTGAVPLPRAGHSACSIGCQVFFFGGGDSDDLFSDLHVLDTSYLTQDRSKQDSNQERESASAVSPHEPDWAEVEQEAQAFKVKAEVSTVHIKDALKSAREQLSKSQIELSAKTRNVAAAVFALEQSNALNFEQLNQYVTKVEAVVSRELDEIKHSFEHYRLLTGYGSSRRLPIAPPAPIVEPRNLLESVEVRTRSPSDDVARQVKVALRRPAVRYEELKKVPEGDESPLVKSRATPPVTTPSVSAPLSPIAAIQVPTRSCSPLSSNSESNLITPTLVFPSPSNSISTAQTPTTTATTSTATTSSSPVAATSATTTITRISTATTTTTSIPTPAPTPVTTASSSNTKTTAASSPSSAATTTSISIAATTLTPSTPPSSSSNPPRISSPASSPSPSPLLIPSLSQITSTSTPASTPIPVLPPTAPTSSTTSCSSPSSLTIPGAKECSSRSSSVNSTPHSLSAANSPLFASTNMSRSPLPTPKTVAAPTPSSPPSAAFRNSGSLPSVTVIKGEPLDIKSNVNLGANSASSSNSHTPKGSPARSGSGSSSPSNFRGLKGTSAKVSNWGKNATTSTKTTASSSKTDGNGRSRSCSKGDPSAAGRRGSCPSNNSAASTRLLWKQKEQETQQLKFQQQRNRPPVTVQVTTQAPVEPIIQPDVRLPVYSGIDPQLYADPLDQLGPQGLLESFQRLQREEEEYVDLDGSGQPRLPVGVVPLTPEQILHLQQKQAHLASLLDRHGYSQSFNRPTILSALISSSAPTLPASQPNPAVNRSATAVGPPPPPPKTK